jgi:hypothetical protein
MSVQKNISSVKTINWSNQIVYDKLSNLEFLNFMFSPENMERVKSQMGDKAPDMKIENFHSDKDSCTFELPNIGVVGLKIIERDELKLVKIESDEKTPIKLKLWIQLLPLNDVSCKMRITLHSELNMMMKMMIGKKLDKGIEQIADSLAQIPYGRIPNN